MKMIKVLNWILAILGVIIVIALVIVALPWKNWGANKASEADDKVPATVDESAATAVQTVPPPPEQVILRDAKVGDCVVFGHYEQDNDEANGPEEIEWLVLDKDGDALLLLSLYGLDCQPYHDKIGFVYWSTSALRPWLNESFLPAAFSEEEQAMIEQRTATADPNPEYNSLPGADVDDKVFLLSIAEADRYFSHNDERLCVPTAYARAQGAYVRSGFVACWWWLRTPGDYGTYASCIGNLGDFYYVGLNTRAADVAIRPAIWLNTGA